MTGSGQFDSEGRDVKWERYARVLARRDTDAVRLEALADLRVARDVVRRGRLLDEPGSAGRIRVSSWRSPRRQTRDAPGVEGLKLLDVVDGLRDVPDLVGIDHEDGAGGRGVLAGDRLGRDLLAPLGQVRRVVNDLADDAPAPEVVLDVGADLELGGGEEGGQGGQSDARVPLRETARARLP